ncbi:MAG: Holliday junction resolvase RuvX [Mycoplasmatales bacterium]
MPSKLLGIDYGEKRIGLALSDPLKIIASPYKIINNDQTSIHFILELIKKENIEQIIIGLPLNMNGTTGFQAKIVIDFKDQLKEQVNIPIVFEDERLSSKKVKEVNKDLKVKNEYIDDKAAAIILQNYLDYN